VYAPSAVAATDDRDDFACLFVVVGGDELDERLVWRSAAEEGDDVTCGRGPRALANRLAKADLNRARSRLTARGHPLLSCKADGLDTSPPTVTTMHS
jgi:hypothetical protein